MQNQNSNFNYYQYGSPNFNPFTPKDPLINRDARRLTKLSLLAGAGVLGFVAVQQIVVVILSAVGLFSSDMSFSEESLASVVLSLTSILIPFLAIYAFYDKDDKERCFELGEPVSKKCFLLAVSAGLMICCMSDYLTAGFSGFASTFGIEFASYDTSSPSNAAEMIIFIIECAVIPALTEEIAVRGIIMQPLRRYGDKFAIIMSSVIFALMHRNINQIPFAFVAGIALGYFACATGSIWTSIVIHFANNLFSVIVTTVNDYTQYGGFVYYILTGIIIVGGAFAMLAFIKSDHFGLELTLAPKNEKRMLTAATAVFVFISFVFAMFSPARPSAYIITAAVLIICLVRYIKSNSALRSGDTGSIETKLKASLYCATPTVIIAFVVLIFFTLKSVTVNSAVGYSVCYAALLAALALTAYMVYKVISSKIIESKTAYHISLAVLAGVCFIGMLTVIASRVSIYSYIQ